MSTQARIIREGHSSWITVLIEDGELVTWSTQFSIDNEEAGEDVIRRLIKARHHNTAAALRAMLDRAREARLFVERLPSQPF